ncbi:MAG: ERF family protein [Ilumatobacteraceae bacterium]
MTDRNQVGNIADPPNPVGVVAALAAVIRDLPAIGKADSSPEGYRYRGIEAITASLQPLLGRHGVIIVPSVTITQVVPSPAMKDGWQDVYVVVDWTIFGPDGSSITARTNGIGRDRADKGANKGQTQAYKYLLLHLLAVADRADDSDGLTYERDRADTPDHDGVEALRVFDALRGLPDDARASFRAWAAGRSTTLTALHDAGWRGQVDEWIRSLGAP